MCIHFKEELKHDSSLFIRPRVKFWLLYILVVKLCLHWIAVNCDIYVNYNYFVNHSKWFLSMWLQIMENCGCISEWHAVDVVYHGRELESGNYAMCSNHTTYDGSPVEPEHSFMKMLCTHRLEDTMKPCKCKMPCDETTYDVSVSSSGSWPHKSFLQAFYNSHVDGTSYGNRIDKHAKDTVSPLLLLDVAES